MGDNAFKLIKLDRDNWVVWKWQFQNDESKALAVKAKGKKGKPNVDKDQCRYCKESGHWIKDCPNLKTPYDPSKLKKRDKKDDSSKKNNSKDKDLELAFISKTSLQGSLSDKLWVADTGATNHMTPYKHLFDTFTPMDGSGEKIELADNSEMKIYGQGTILTIRGKLENVFYVPDLGQNLFSVSTAQTKGLTLVGTKDKMVFYHDDKEVFSAILMNKLFLIEFQLKDKPMAKAATIQDWHARLGHTSMDTIKHMIKNNVVDGLDIVNENPEKCQGCLMNKCTIASHPKRTTARATLAGTVLHIDTAGPSNVIGRHEYKYFVLCKDESSSYRQVVFVETKDQIPNKVKEFISRANLETGNFVLKVVTDFGTEFNNKDLSTFFANRGILHEQSVPYTPQQNGFIERDIGTIKRSAKAMLNDSDLKDKSLWPYAIHCAVYASNRVVNSTNKMKTPYELWNKDNNKPNVKNLRIFGELAILKKPDCKLETSWDEKGSRAAFIGYGDRFNTFRFLENGKIVISCNAVFPNRMFSSMDEIQASERNDEDFWISEKNTDKIQATGNAHVQTPETARITRDLTSLLNRSIELDSSHEEYQEGSDFPNLLINQASSSASSSSNATFQPPLPPSNVVLNPIPAPMEPQAPTPPAERAQAPPVERIQVSTDQARNQMLRFIETNKDVPLRIDLGTATYNMKVGDIKYSTSTQRWKNKRTGHFISHNDLRTILTQAQQHIAAQPRAMLATISKTIPKNYQEAIDGDFSEEYIPAMDDEINSLITNEVFEVIPRSHATKKSVGSRWVYAIKLKQDGNIEKFKARVVAKGYSQRYGIDYGETYCSVVQIMSTRLLLAYSAKKRLKMRQFDIKTAFLYGSLNEEIFMEPPEGYSEPNTVWKLKRSLYGLKQSPRMWNEKFTKFMSDYGLEMSQYDNSVFFRLNPILIVIVYVDDGLIMAEDESDVVDLLEKLRDTFEMREMEVTIYRGVEIQVRDNGIFIHQARYTQKILETFSMDDAKSADNPTIVLNEESDEPLDADTPYRQAVGSLAYLADTTRPDIAFAVNQLARKMAAPTTNDWKRAKQVFRYLKGSIKYGIMYKSNPSGIVLHGFSDSDFAGDNDSSKSTTGYVIKFHDAPFHWKTQLQRHVTLSSTEAEVIALCALSKEMSWIRRMMIELNIMAEEPAVIECDNQSALKIVQSERCKGRTRHLRAQDDYIREQIKLDELKLHHVKSDKQQADLLTKVVATGKFISNRIMLLTL